MNRFAVHAIGDSVMQACAPALYGTLPAAIPGITIDAEPSRQFRHALDLVDRRYSTRSEPGVLIVHLGTNGLFSANHFDTLMEAAGRANRVLFVNLCAPRDWIPETNRRLASGVERHRDRATLVDWLGLVESAPGLLRDDRFHMNWQGATAYADLLAAAVAQLGAIGDIPSND
jgi:lysophospholipase L1-like esterase